MMHGEKISSTFIIDYSNSGSGAVREVILLRLRQPVRLNASAERVLNCERRMKTTRHLKVGKGVDTFS